MLRRGSQKAGDFGVAVFSVSRACGFYHFLPRIRFAWSVSAPAEARVFIEDLRRGRNYVRSQSDFSCQSPADIA